MDVLYVYVYLRRIPCRTQALLYNHFIVHSNNIYNTECECAAEENKTGRYYVTCCHTRYYSNQCNMADYGLLNLTIRVQICPRASFVP